MIETEAEWLACDDPGEMLGLVDSSEGSASLGLTVRKARLFAVSSCRLARGQLKLLGLDVLDIAERFADGAAEDQELLTLCARLDQIVRFESLSILNAVRTTLRVSCSPQRVVADTLRGVHSNTPTPVTALVPLARDIFVNPFRPVTFDPMWNTSTVVSLAQGMYTERDFSAMPILADALQDAGCNNDDILTHCRGPGPHVRGCWVVDALLGKS